MILCLHLPRFELTLAAGGPEEAIAGRALAIAPAMDDSRVGECSGAAEAAGVTPGMALGEALARCPELVLLPGDPIAAERAWERVLRSLEGIGAAPESSAPGLAFFDADGLLGVHGGLERTVAAARRAVRAATAGRGARVGGGPSRFCALAAALDAGSHRALLLDGAPAVRRLGAQPVSLLGHREDLRGLVEPLQRLGIATLGELAELSQDALADRFGETGLLAGALARGVEGPLRPRVFEESLEEFMQVGEAGSGPMLERVLGVLVDRLLARPERRGRTLRAMSLSARLLEGGTWRERVVLREPISDSMRLRLALGLRLGALPAPAAELGLAVESFGPPAGEQRTLLDDARTRRLEGLRGAAAQLRELAGEQGALRVLEVDPDSHVPERRSLLTPFLEGGPGRRG